MLPAHALVERLVHPPSPTNLCVLTGPDSPCRKGLARTTHHALQASFNARNKWCMSAPLDVDWRITSSQNTASDSTSLGFSVQTCASSFLPAGSLAAQMDRKYLGCTQSHSNVEHN